MWYVVSAKKQSMPIVLHQLRRCRISKLLPAYARSILEFKPRLSTVFFALHLHVFPYLTYKMEVNRPPIKSSKSNTKIPVTTKINIDSYYTFGHSYGSNYDIKKG
jgi:hypothetical protein